MMMPLYAQSAPTTTTYEQQYRERCDILVPMTITSTEAQRGAERTFHYYAADGRLYSMPVQIPPCPPTGGSVRIADAGGVDPVTSQRGDLIIALHVVADQRARYEGDDLHITVPITRAMLAQGHELLLQVREGVSFNFKLPAGSKADARFRWEGWGAPSRTKAGFGELIVTLQCLDPLPAEVMNEKPKTAFQRFGDTLAPLMILLGEIGLFVVILFFVMLWLL
jgi:hypothetical protein